MNFHGTLAGVEYTEPVLFAADVKAYNAGTRGQKIGATDTQHRGYPALPKNPSLKASALTADEREWLGMSVNVPAFGSIHRGQVWSLSWMRGHLNVVIPGENGNQVVTVPETAVVKVESIRLAAERHADLLLV